MVEANDDTDLSVIGLYGAWAASLQGSKLPSLSFRRPEFTKLEKWRKSAKQRVIERLAIPDLGGLPKLTFDVWIDDLYFVQR